MKIIFNTEQLKKVLTALHSFNASEYLKKHKVDLNELIFKIKDIVTNDNSKGKNEFNFDFTKEEITLIVESLTEFLILTEALMTEPELSELIENELIEEEIFYMTLIFSNDDLNEFTEISLINTDEAYKYLYDKCKIQEKIKLFQSNEYWVKEKESYLDFINNNLAEQLL